MTTAGVVSDVVSGVVSSVVAGDVGGASPPAGPTLAFHAATFDASTYEMEPVSVGVGSGTFAVDDGLLLPDWESIYRTTDEDTAPQHGARKVTNLVFQSEALDDAFWITNNTTVGSGVADPYGGTSAYSLTATAAVTGNTIGWGKLNYYNYPNVWDCLNSIWIRRVTGTGTVRMLAGRNYFWIDITSAITGSWQRISILRTSSPATFASFGLQLQTSGDVIEVWHPQSEDVTGQTNQNPGEYVPTSGTAASAYYANENGNTVSSNVVTEAVGTALTEAPSLYSAPAMTNLLTYSNDLTNAAWGGTASRSLDAVGITGAPNTATTITSGAANQNAVQVVSVSSPSAVTMEVWLAKNVGTGPVRLAFNVTGVNNNNRVDVDTSDGSITGVLRAVAEVEDIGDFYRVLFEYDGAVSSATAILLSVIPSTTGADTCVVANTGIYSGKTIAEIKGSAPIITAGSTVSVAGTAIAFDESNISAQTNGVVYFEQKSLGSSILSNSGLWQGGLSSDVWISLNSGNGVALNYYTNTSDSKAFASTGGGWSPDTWYGFGYAAHDGSGEIVAKKNGVAGTGAANFKTFWKKSPSGEFAVSRNVNTQPNVIRNIRIYSDFSDFDAAEATLDELMP